MTRTSTTVLAGPALAIATAIAATLAARGADGQPARSNQDVATSREQFGLGVAAARAGRWAEARVAFERAYAAVPSTLILFNLAGVQVRTGQLLAGAESYRRFLAASDQDPAAASYRAVAAQALTQVEQRTPHVRVAVRGAAVGADVWLDGRPQPAAVRDVDVPADPGAHLAELRRGARTIATGRCALAEGARCEIVLVAPVAPPSALVADGSRSRAVSSAPAAGGSSAWLSPWLWGTVAAVVVLGAGAMATGVAIANAAPYSGTIAPGRAEVP